MLNTLLMSVIYLFSLVPHFRISLLLLTSIELSTRLWISLHVCQLPVIASIYQSEYCIFYCINNKLIYVTWSKETCTSGFVTNMEACVHNQSFEGLGISPHHELFILSQLPGSPDKFPPFRCVLSEPSEFIPEIDWRQLLESD